MPHTEVSLVSPLLSSCQHLLQSNGSIDGNEVADAILPNFPSLSSAIPADYFAGKNGILSIDGRTPLTHYRIREFIMANLGPALHGMGYGRGHRIALVLPNGPELALAILAVSNWASCVPLNAYGATIELQKDLQMSGASMVIGMADTSATIQDMAKALHIPFCGLNPSKTESGIFDLVPMSSNAMHVPKSPRRNRRMRPDNDICCNPKAFDDVASDFSASFVDNETNFLSNEHDDEVIVLFTSGTTGTKKLVPHKLGDMLIASACIALSWNLKPEDVNCNLMPLFHVGGIVRQIFAPILSAGSVICCPAFDPQTFWNLLQESKFTWYYAAPTMHQIILANLPTAGGGNYKLRMIANAAGGLLPSLAEELRAVFGANVLPSYGMTECMPISSPPASYELEKPGTSGVAVGPQIRIFSNNFEIQTPGREGRICVRGRPCFGGYGGGDQKSSFLQGGWFNTGDLGYLDQDGYLFITGRSKEVINRGGEIISPLEVEEAVLSHPTVHNCLAFSAAHDVLQEVVGIVVVTKPGTPRVDLATLHEFLQEKLTLQKWPQCLVFMDGLPKSDTSKLLRVKMGQRLNLPLLDDCMYPLQRTFEARCPPQGTPVGVSIPSFPVNVNMAYVQATLREELKINKDLLGPPQDLVLAPHPSKYGALVAHVYNVDRIDMIRVAQNRLDAYLMPSHICRYSDLIDPDHLKQVQHTDAVASLLQDSTGPVDPLVQDIQELVRELLDLDCIPSPDTNFFHVGGSSLLASQLASKIRKRHKVSFPGADVFRHSTCEAMAKCVQELMHGHKAITSRRQSPDEFDREIDGGIKKLEDLEGVPFQMHRLAPETSWLRSLFQLVPLFVVFPAWQLCRFFGFFMCLLAALKHVPGERNIWKFVLTLVVYHFLWVAVTPLVFVLIKWMVIGRYKKGRYAIWSTYYLRWWFVDVCRKMFGCGIWGSHSSSLRVYYRMLGATIGEGVRFAVEADIAEYDLVTIGDYAKIEYASVRGFGVDNGAMLLGPVNIGPYSSVGARSVVAPFTSIPANHHLGPAASSYEVLNGDDNHLAYNRQALPEPSMLMQTFVGHPIIFLVETISHIPALTVLVFMVTLHASHGYDGFYTIGDLLEWLCDVRRLPYFVGIRVVRAIVAPFV
jgi:acyl-CoA synthetase (AMP-forming)/AMP-acid ligase II/serine acetyltransferase